MSFSPIIRVRKFLDKMRTERDSPRGIKRFPSRTLSSDYECQKSRRGDYSMDMTPLVEQFRKFSEHFDLRFGENTFDVLPVEAVLLVFSFLDTKDLATVRRVSKEWNLYAEDDLLWKRLCIADFQVDVLYGDSWKQTYKYLDELFSDGLWEGMSKWVEPAGFDNEQKTTVNLHFLKRKQGKLINSPSLSRISSPATIHRVDSSVNATESKYSDSFKDSEFRIVGTGVTINCSNPSAFLIEGERTKLSSTGSSFKWNKQFEKHTSMYEGTIDYAERVVSGTIDYHDGITHWKGVFYYTKSQRTTTNTKQKFQAIA